MLIFSLIGHNYIEDQDDRDDFDDDKNDGNDSVPIAMHRLPLETQPVIARHRFAPSPK